MSTSLSVSPEARTNAPTEAEAPSQGFTVRSVHGGERFTPAPIAQIANSTGVLATARGPNGRSISDTVKDTDIVSVGGVEMTAKQAAGYGALSRNSDGTYSDVDDYQLPHVKAAAEREAAAQQAPDDSHALDVGEDTTNGLEFVTGAVRSVGGNPVQILGAILAGGADRLPDVFTEVSRKHGVPLHEVAAHVHAAGSAFERDLAADLKRTAGVDNLSHCWAYLNRTVPKGTLMAAVSSAVFQGDVRPLRELGRRYVSATGNSRGSVTKDAGVEVMIGGRAVRVSREYAARLAR